MGEDVEVVGLHGRGAPPLLAEHRAALPSDLSSPGVARRMLGVALSESGRSHWAENAELALSEVVANAVLHAHSPITLTVRVHRDSVEVEVEDLNGTPPSVRDCDSEVTTGRGMGMVAALTSSALSGRSPREAKRCGSGWPTHDLPQTPMSSPRTSSWQPGSTPATGTSPNR
jgi:anti-sigma regulatory factor (Ser/Thr protein kinase)